MSEPLQFPDWQVPPERSGQVSFEAWLQWIEENRRALIKAGQLQALRDDPLRCPVNVRFEL